MSRVKSLGIQGAVVALGLLVIMLAGTLAASVLLPQEAYASNTTMWVVAKSKKAVVGEDDSTTVTYAYNKKGLLKQRRETFGDLYESKTTYAYDKKNCLKYAKVFDNSEKEDIRDYKQTYKLNSKGYVTKASVNSGSIAYKYNSKGLLTTIRCSGMKESLTYDKKNRLKTYTSYYDGNVEKDAKVAYTKKGLLKSYSYDTSKYVYTSKKGRTVKVVLYDRGKKTSVTTYTYKRVKVPASLVSMVKAQQTSIFISDYPIEAAHQ